MVKFPCSTFADHILFEIQVSIMVSHLFIVCIIQDTPVVVLFVPQVIVCPAFCKILKPGLSKEVTNIQEPCVAVTGIVRSSNDFEDVQYCLFSSSWVFEEIFTIGGSPPCETFVCPNPYVIILKYVFDYGCSRNICDSKIISWHS